MTRYRVLTVGCVLVLTACGNTEDSDTAVENTLDNAAIEAPESRQQLPEFAEPALPSVDSPNYLKPGAAVTFSHDYDDYTDPGIRDSFVLNVKPAYMVGVLHLSFSTSAGLDLLIDAEQSFEISGEVFAIPVEIFAENAGVYRLNVSASVDTGAMMPSMRGHTVTINVGTQPEASQKTDQSLLQTPDTEPVISNTAKETIY